jgi:hypothetical protein
MTNLMITITFNMCVTRITGQHVEFICDLKNENIY